MALEAGASVKSDFKVSSGGVAANESSRRSFFLKSSASNVLFRNRCPPLPFMMSSHRVPAPRDLHLFDQANLAEVCELFLDGPCNASGLYFKTCAPSPLAQLLAGALVQLIAHVARPCAGSLGTTTLSSLCTLCAAEPGKTSSYSTAF